MEERVTSDEAAWNVYQFVHVMFGTLPDNIYANVGYLLRNLDASQ
jgi:hypothetical protein